MTVKTHATATATMHSMALVTVTRRWESLYTALFRAGHMISAEALLFHERGDGFHLAASSSKYNKSIAVIWFYHFLLSGHCCQFKNVIER